MYTREDKLKAVELFIKYDFSPAVRHQRARLPMQGIALQLGIGNI